MKACITIPARTKSTRLPNKMLADINGTPMIVRVFENCKKSSIKDVFVATDSDEIKNIIESRGGKAVLTDPELPSGTDRIFAGLNQNNLIEQFDVIVNVQGDVPNISPILISDIAALLAKDEHASIATAVVKIMDKEKIENPNVVKAILSFRGPDFASALYFTRATAPFGEGDLFEHIGIYAYKREALKKFVFTPPSTLEKRERLEQLRALEEGMKIIAKVTDFEPLSVDTMEDLERARKAILNSSL